MIKKILITTLITSTVSFSSSIYTHEYMSEASLEKKHIATGIPNILSGSTLIGKKRIAHVSVYFSEGEMTESSEEKLQALFAQAQAPYYVSIIGHSSEYIDEYHKIRLSPWAEFWQNLGSAQATSVENVNGHLQAVYDYLQKNNVPSANIYNENRMNADPISTEATSTGRALNSRVDITLYN